MLHLIKKWDEQSHHYTVMRYATSEEEAIINKALATAKKVKDWIKRAEQRAAELGLAIDRYIDDEAYYTYNDLYKEASAIEEKARALIDLDVLGRLPFLY